MARYKFRLATLLKLRESARDERRQALADAMHAEQLLIERCEEIDATLAELKQQTAARSVGALNLDALLEVQRYEMLQRANRQALAAQQRAVAAEVETRRAALAEADRAVRALELLRETQLARHQQEERRRETKQLDEVAGQRWLRGARR